MKTDKRDLENTLKNNILILLLSFYLGVYFELFFETKQSMVYGAFNGLLNGTLNLMVLLRCTLVTMGAFLCIRLLVKSRLEYVERYRYGIALLVLIVCVFFKINGSSNANVWRFCFGGLTNEKELMESGIFWGIPRGIRSDEWAVYTPMAFSQKANGFAAMSELLRGIPTDVTTTYGLPAIAVVTLFRPFLWGYFFLDVERGLSFFWVARFLALFLSSYECARVYTRDNKTLSAAAAVLVTFSPSIQWWFNTNGLVEMLVFGQYAVVLFSTFFKEKATRNTRILCALGLIECGGGFIFTYYPAQEVPFGYVFAALVLSVVISGRKNIDWRKDGALLLGAVAILAVLCFLIMRFSADTFSAIQNTVYPGHRLATGGDASLDSLSGWLQSLFLSVDARQKVGLFSNECEAARMICLFPLGSLIFVYQILNKRKDLMMIFMGCVQLFFLVFCFMGFSKWLSQITLMSNVTTGRLVVVVGVLEIMMLFRGLAFEREEVRESKLGIWGKVSVVVFISALFTRSMYCICPEFAHIVYIVLGFMACAMLLWTLPFRGKEGAERPFFLVVCCIVAASGLTVNPGQVGAPAFKNELIQAIHTIASEDVQAKWVSVDTMFVFNNLLPVAGAKTVNSTNVYPALDVWSEIAPDQEEIYNRYAHINVSITKEKTSFELNQPDLIQLNIKLEDLRKIGVGYMVTQTDFSGYEEVELITTVLGYNIYRIQDI